MYKFYNTCYSIQNYNTITCTTYIHHSISYIHTIHTRTISMCKFVQILSIEISLCYLICLSRDNFILRKIYIGSVQNLSLEVTLYNIIYLSGGNFTSRNVKNYNKELVSEYYFRKSSHLHK